MEKQIILYDLKEIINIAYDKSTKYKIGFYLTINDLIDYYYNNKISVNRKKEIKNKYNLEDIK